MIDVGPCPPGEMLCSDLESSSHMKKLIGWAIDLGSFGSEGGTGSSAVKVLSISALICNDRYPIRILASASWLPGFGPRSHQPARRGNEQAKWTGKIVLELCRVQLVGVAVIGPALVQEAKMCNVHLIASPSLQTSSQTSRNTCISCRRNHCSLISRSYLTANSPLALMYTPRPPSFFIPLGPGHDPNVSLTERRRELQCRQSHRIRLLDLLGISIDNICPRNGSPLRPRTKDGRHLIPHQALEPGWQQRSFCP